MCGAALARYFKHPDWLQQVWFEIPERYGPPTTCYNRFVRWRKAGVWDRLLEAVSEAYDGDIVMIDSTLSAFTSTPPWENEGMETMAAWDVPAAGLRAKSTRSSTPKVAPSASV